MPFFKPAKQQRHSVHRGSELWSAVPKNIRLYHTFLHLYKQLLQISNLSKQLHKISECTLGIIGTLLDTLQPCIKRTVLPGFFTNDDVRHTPYHHQAEKKRCDLTAANFYHVTKSNQRVSTSENIITVTTSKQWGWLAVKNFNLGYTQMNLRKESVFF